MEPNTCRGRGHRPLSRLCTLSFVAFLFGLACSNSESGGAGPPSGSQGGTSSGGDTESGGTGRGGAAGDNGRGGGAGASGGASTTDGAAGASAGSIDGSVETGGVDSGSAIADSGPGGSIDAGTSRDASTESAGSRDGGVVVVDAGTDGAGLPTVPDNGCNVRLTDRPIGFASLGGGTVGGGNATPILVTTNDQLRTYLADNQPRVLYLMNDLDFRTAPRNVSVCADDVTCDNGSGVQVDNARVSATCDPGEHVATRTRYESRLDVASNKTLIGIGRGTGAAIRGAGLNIGASQQVIVRNLRIYDINPQLVEAGDGVTLQQSAHIWLDHLLLDQISDGYVDIGSATSAIDDFITLSFVHFNGRTAFLCGGHHDFVNFVDNGHVTYHHNWFDNGGGRNPKIGHVASQVHLFNNYWLGISFFCITVQEDGEARVESNYFENSLRPHWLQLDGNGTAGIAIDNGNVYTGASTGNTNRDVGGAVFNVPYPYAKETAAAARTAILNCSGPQPIR